MRFSIVTATLIVLVAACASGSKPQIEPWLPSNKAVPFPDSSQFRHHDRRITIGSIHDDAIILMFAADSVSLLARKDGIESFIGCAEAPGIEHWDMKPMLLPFDGKDCRMLNRSERYWMLPAGQCDYVLACPAFWSEHLALMFLIGGVCGDEGLSFRPLMTRPVTHIPMDTVQGFLYFFEEDQGEESLTWHFSRLKLGAASGERLVSIDSETEGMPVVSDSTSYLAAMRAACERWQRQ